MVVFPGLIFYIIVALIVRKTAKIEVPLCEEHRRRRSKGIRTAWILSLSGIALCFAPAFHQNLIPLVFVGAGMLIGGLIYGSLLSQIVTPRKIDKTHAWLDKVGEPYLASLPPLPTGENEDDEEDKEE